MTSHKGSAQWVRNLSFCERSRLQAVDSEGKNPEAFVSPWGNGDRKP